MVNLVSMTAFRSTTIVPGYAAAKAALLTLTRNLAAHWAGDGIRVNAVAPGLIDTPMTAPMQAFPQLLEGELARAILPRMGTPAEVAAAVLFLSSEAAAFITGGHTGGRRRLPRQLRGGVMGDVIEIDDLGAPVLNDVQRMAIDYGESKTTDAHGRRRV